MNVFLYRVCPDVRTTIAVLDIYLLQWIVWRIRSFNFHHINKISFVGSLVFGLLNNATISLQGRVLLLCSYISQCLSVLPNYFNLFYLRIFFIYSVSTFSEFQILFSSPKVQMNDFMFNANIMKNKWEL